MNGDYVPRKQYEKLQKEIVKLKRKILKLIAMRKQKNG